MKQIVFAGLVSIPIGYVGRSVPANDQMQLFDLLISTAGIVFGVSGAWIAIVHSEELKKSKPQTGRFKNLMVSMIASGVTLAAALAAHATHALLSSWTLPAGLLPWLRGLSFGLWTFFALVQVWSLFSHVPSLLYASTALRRCRLSAPRTTTPAQTRATRQ